MSDFQGKVNFVWSVADEILRHERFRGRLEYGTALISAAVSDEVYLRSYSPDLSQRYSYERGPDGWEAHEGLDEDGQPYGDPGKVLGVHIDLDGGHLFCGRAAELVNGRLLVFENIVAGLTARFLAVMGGLYAAGGYRGPVDVGLAVTGL